jgi:hypothetical protein
VYSEQFDALPSQIKEMIYKRLHEILTGSDKSAKFETLTANDRKAIFEILVETKKDLPAYWRDTPDRNTASRD